MGQTLSNGVYLPNEGERNCYAGLASNWQILNTAVGAIAEKAPLVHTHTVSQITDFPAYGNTAGTICEGNDSRLSDARTPVAHTHTKSDVTDLLNSNFIPSANNSYDLGSASYQWNNFYAKNYYYNGTAWGLDQANEWSANNTFTGGVTIYKNSSSPTTLNDNSLAFNANSNYIFFRTRGSSNIKSYNSWLWSGYLSSSAPNRFGRIKLYRASAIYGETGADTPDTSFSFIDVAVHYKWVSLTDNVRFINDETNNACEPLTNNATDLGTSTNRWKTLNGINPGALSLPDTLGTSGTENVNYFNVIGYLNNTGAKVTIPTTATYDGWLYLNAKDGADSYIIIDDSPANFGTSVFGNNGLGSTSVGLLCLICPIRAGHSYHVRIKSAGIVSARIYPAQGNV